MRNSVRRILVIVLAAGVVAGVALAAAWASTSGGTKASKPQLTEGRILRIALRSAAAAGDATPTLIQHSEGTRYHANRVASGDIVPGGRWSYLIAVRGHFVLKDASVPMGASAPRGTVLTLVINARTGEGTDGGVSDRYPDLSKLGPVHTDLRQHTTARKRADGSRTAYTIDIQATYDQQGNPVLGANFSPNASLATSHWEICSPPNTSICRPARSSAQFLQPGPAADQSARGQQILDLGGDFHGAPVIRPDHDLDPG
jgi:hypothetical protein